MTASADIRSTTPRTAGRGTTSGTRRKRSRGGGPLGTRAWFLVPGVAFLFAFSAIPIF